MSTSSSPLRGSQESDIDLGNFPVNSPSLIKCSSFKPGTGKDSFQPLNLEAIFAERQQRLQQQETMKNLLDNDQLLQNSVLGSNLDLSQEIAPHQEDKIEEEFIFLDVFDLKYLFHIFTVDSIKFSWLQKDYGIPDIPNMRTEDFGYYLKTEVKSLCYRRSTSATACRYLFYLVAVHEDPVIAEIAHDVLLEQLDNNITPFILQIPDLLTVLINYGSKKSKLWPAEYNIDFPAIHTKDNSNIFKSPTKSNRQICRKFPKENLRLVLQILLHYLKRTPHYNEEEKEGLFFLLLNLAMARYVAEDWNMIVLIKEIMIRILASYSKEEWHQSLYRKVENLTLMCWRSDLSPLGIVQRIEYIPVTTLRGIQLKQCAAFFAMQQLMNVDPITLSGVVSLDEILQLFERKKMSGYPSDIPTVHSIIMLLSLSIDIDELSDEDKRKLKLFRAYLNEWRHSIPDCSNDLDRSRFAVKDLMTQLCTIWNDIVPVDGVV